ncbi:MAG: 2-oxoacid:acceptor oxidoreductase family protein [Ruminococcus flavefaciens]|nr:2-oxoacid:acceptor oxidoreductase family protein [Ruminococcus flavefaciens]
MTEILWLGRGGQGAFTSAKLLGAAYTSTDEEKYALAFPSFGPERRGAPVKAFTKLSDKPVLDRSETEQADYIVILDETLYNSNLNNILKENGKIIVNSKAILGDDIISFDADSIAKELRLPVVNTIMIGVLSAISGIVSTENIISAIENYMPEKLHEKNINAVKRAVGEVLK